MTTKQNAPSDDDADEGAKKPFDNSNSSTPSYCSGSGVKHIGPCNLTHWEDICERVENPQCVPKPEAQWIMPSSYPSRSAREQEEKGEFQMITGDVDNSPGFEKVEAVVKEISPGTDYVIFTTKSATEDNEKLRILKPLAKGVSFPLWQKVQCKFNDLLEQHGITTDRATERPHQISFLPNQGEIYKTASRRHNKFLDPHKFLQDAATPKNTDIADLIGKSKDTDISDLIEVTAAISDTMCDGVAQFIKKCVEDLRDTNEGGRNDALNKNAFMCFGLVKAERAEYVHVRGKLFAAAIEIGLESSEIEATLKSAWRKAKPDYRSYKPNADDLSLLDTEPTLKIKSGDHLQLAQLLVAKKGRENLIFAESAAWQWNGGRWRKIEDRAIKNMVQRQLPIFVEKVTRGLVDGVAELFKNEIFMPNHQFNIGNPETVNCLNGELSLDNSGKWILQPHCREHYRTTQIPVAFDPKATAPRFEQFMREIFQGDPDIEEKTTAILEMIGYTFMAHCRHERYIILVGNGANGKSVLLVVVEALCGSENVAGVQPSQLHDSFKRAHLHGKLANIVSEVKQGEVIDDASLKSIVSGEPTTVDHKFKDPFVMRPFATPWFGTNHMPHTRDFSDALFRRALVVSFNNVFRPEVGNCDPNLKDKLKAELPGIFNMALDAYAKALQNGFTMPSSCVNARNEWRLEADQVARFVEERCQRDLGARTQSSGLFQAYRHWAADNGINKTLTMTSFVDRLKKMGFKNERSNAARFVTGVTLVIDEPGLLDY